MLIITTYLETSNLLPNIKDLQTNKYYCIYIDFNGSFNIAETFNEIFSTFRIKLVDINNGIIKNFTAHNNVSPYDTDIETKGRWTTTILQLNKLDNTTIRNDLRIGPYGNTSLTTSIYSFVATTLRNNQLLPSDNEILYMCLDPYRWLKWYKHNKPFRKPHGQIDEADNFRMNEGSPITTECTNSTLVYLFGDGTNDDNITNIFNQVNSADSYSSLVATDIPAFVEEEIRNNNVDVDESNDAYL